MDHHQQQQQQQQPINLSNKVAAAFQAAQVTNLLNSNTTSNDEAQPLDLSKKLDCLVSPLQQQLQQQQQIIAANQNRKPSPLSTDPSKIR